MIQCNAAAKRCQDSVSVYSVPRGDQTAQAADRHPADDQQTHSSTGRKWIDDMFIADASGIR
jgi:hypothetical protein